MYGSEDHQSYRDLRFAELRTSHAGLYVCVGQLVSVAADTTLEAREECRLDLTSECVCESM